MTQAQVHLVPLTLPNRNNDDGQTVEVLRVATDGTPNTPSALLGACARAAKAIGAARIITYTLIALTLLRMWLS